MWTLIGTPKTQKATKKLAQEFSSMDAAPHDRPLSERRLLVYERLLKEGKFRPITWASAFCKETGGTYRVNGKHTSMMLVAWDDPVDLYITVERYECDTLDDVGRLYATFDSKMQSRSANDIYYSFAACVPELRDVAVRTIPLSVAGMGLYLSGPVLNTSRTQPADRAELLLEHSPFVVWLDELLQGKSNVNSHMKRAAVCAAIFATYQKHSPDALKFWEEVRDETAPKPGLPSRKLAHYLVANFSRMGKGKQRVAIKDREVYCKCLTAWNAWRKDESTNLNYHIAADLPKAV